VQPHARAAFQRLLAEGWAGALRALHPDGLFFTVWGYLGRRWPNDMRLDHLLLSPDLASGLAEVGVSRAVRGAAGASDHAPTSIELAPQARRRAA